MADKSGPTDCASAAASALHTKTLKIASDLAREAVGCIPPSRRAVTPHQMTGRYPIRSRVRRRPVITMGGLGGA